MARPTEFVDLDYDRRLAEFKAMKEKMKKEMAEEDQQSKKK